MLARETEACSLLYQTLSHGDTFAPLVSSMTFTQDDVDVPDFKLAILTVPCTFCPNHHRQSFPISFDRNTSADQLIVEAG
jgi:hypothetical protein